MSLDVTLDIFVKVFLTWSSCLVASLLNHQNVVEAASVTILFCQTECDDFAVWTHFPYLLLEQRETNRIAQV